MSITLTELLASTRIHLADAQCSESAFWDNDDLTLYINEALLSLWSLFPSDALRNYEDVDTQNLVSGTPNYDLPTNFYIELSVIYNDIPCRKFKYSDQAIISNNTYYKALSSQPGYTINDDDIYLFPTPSANSTEGLEFYFLTKPPVLNGSTTSVNIDVSYSPIVSKFAAGRAVTLKESIAEGQALSQAALEDLKLYIGKDKKEEEE